MQPNQPTSQPSEQTPPSPEPQAQPSVTIRPLQTLQPLSSEEDIRREAEQAAPQPAAPTSTSPDERDAAATEPTSYGLVTEPLHPQQPQVSSPIPVAHPVATPPAEAPKRKTGLVIFFVLLLVAGIVAAIFFVLPLVFGTKLSTNDLVKETYQSTTYLRPKQWKPITSPTGSAYGDLKAKDGKSTAAVNLRIVSNRFEVAESDYPLLRTQILDGFTEETLMSSTGSDPCTSVTDIQKQADTTTTATMVGLVRLTATCNRSSGSFIMKIHGVVGKDGYARIITVVATQQNWKDNQAVFETMLDSVQ